MMFWVEKEETLYAYEREREGPRMVDKYHIEGFEERSLVTEPHLYLSSYVAAHGVDR